jgi:hypothetical protein
MPASRLFALGLASAGALAACSRYVDIGARTDASDATPGVADTSTPEASLPDIARSDASTPDAASSILWSSNFESGDSSEWNQGGATVGGTFSRLVIMSVAEERAHTGTRAMKIGFDTSDGQDHMAELYRRVEPGPAYYSAWYFISEMHAPDRYWTVLYFFYQKEPGNSATRHGLWDVNLDRQSVYFYDEPGSHQTNPQPRKTYPIGQWFHLEAYFAYEPARNGHVTVWLDGDQILDVPNLGVAASDNLYWGIGSDSNGMDPPRCTMYVDDAKISTTRLGP